MAKINDTDRTTLATVQRELASVSADRSKAVDLSKDIRLADAAQKIQDVQSRYDADAETQGDLAHMLGDVQNLQALAASPQDNSEMSSDAWEQQMNDVGSLAASYANAGDRTSYTSTTLGEPITDRTGFGGDLGRAPDTSAFYKLNTSPATIIEANAKTKQYSIFDADGKMVKQFDYKDASGYAVKTSSGQVLALSTQGYDKSWLRNGDGGREVIDAAHGSTQVHSTAVTLTPSALGTEQGAKAFADTFNKGSSTTQKRMLRGLANHTIFDIKGEPDLGATAKKLAQEGLGFDTSTLKVTGQGATQGQTLSAEELGTAPGAQKLEAYYKALPTADQKIFDDNFKSYAKYDARGEVSFKVLADDMAKKGQGVNLADMTPTLNRVTVTSTPVAKS